MNRYVNPVDVLGPDVAKRVGTLKNGRRYVQAGQLATGMAWLADFLVFVVGLVAGTVVLASRPTLDDGQRGLGVIILLVAVPLLYGVFYGTGRGLGGLLAGTRLVRVKDGGRVGFAGPWAMLVRVLLLPFVIVAVVFGGGVGSPPGSFRRVSLDVAATNRLWAAEAPANS
ncbi:hypothetical protein [Kribbella sp. DT2]|uniref:hypothetical protein n=1 Tax=Kribbella sp. DT2 TaxID=3393427 RepID=UPI003CF4ABA6